MALVMSGAVDPAKGAIRPQVDFANRERRTARIPPMGNMFGLGPGGEDACAPRIEEARDHDLVVVGRRNLRGFGILSRRGGVSVSWGNISSPPAASLANSPPRRRTSLPRGGGTVRASRRYP